MSEQHILVTGGAGFIGSRIVGYYLDKGVKVWAIDNLQTGRIENILPYQNHPFFVFDQADICEWPRLHKAVQWADRIYHMAAVIGQRLVLQNPYAAVSQNIKACELILQAMSQADKEIRLLIASTSEVYSHSPTNTYGASSEEDMIAFSSGKFIQEAYPLSKLVNEVMGLSFVSQYGLHCTIARIFNTIGPNQRSRYGMVVPSFTQQALQQIPLTVFGDGLQTRSFCNVQDTVEAFALLLETPACKGQIVNVGNDEEISIIDLAKLILTKTNSNSDICFISYKEAYGLDFQDVRKRKPNLQKLFNLTGFKAKLSLDQTIEQIIQAFNNKKL